ncbi:MAG: hypothetical protein ACRENP_12330 [Longimicrobiales bacterium]
MCWPDISRALREASHELIRLSEAARDLAWHREFRRVGLSLANAVGIHEWWEWDADDAWLPRDCLMSYARGEAFSADLLQRIGRAIEQHAEFQRLDAYVAERVQGDLGTARSPIARPRLEQLVQAALDQGRGRILGHGFDSELRAVVGAIHGLRVRGVTVRTYSDTTSPRVPDHGVVWQASTDVSDVYDFVNNVRSPNLRELRDRWANMMRLRRYEAFALDYTQEMMLESSASRQAVIAYYFHACESIGIFRPIPWVAQANLRHAWVGLPY